jgi:Uma2 family endonuclease
VFQAVIVRLKTGRVPIPDLVVAEVGDPDGSLVTADELLLVCEIVSPSNATADRVTKMHYYAEAGIPWYLLIDPDGPLMSLFRLHGDRYVLHDEGAPRIPLRFPDPLGVEVDPATLLDE